MRPGLEKFLDIRKALKALDQEALQAILDQGVDWDDLAESPLKYITRPLYSPKRNAVQLAMAQALIDAGADVNAEPGTFDYLRPPIWCAVDKNNLDMIRLLIAAGATVDETREFPCAALWSPLHMAASNGYAEAARLLIAAGATERADFADATPMHRLLLRVDNVEPTFAALLDGKLDLDIVSSTKDGLAGGTVLAELIQRGVSERPLELPRLLEMVERLLDRGADINAKTVSGDTPLHLAGAAHAEELFRALVKLGADPTLRNPAGKTAEDLLNGPLPPEPMQVELFAKRAKSDSVDRVGDRLTTQLTEAPELPVGVLLTLDLGRVRDDLAGTPAVFLELPMCTTTVDLLRTDDGRYRLAGAQAGDPQAFWEEVETESGTPFRKLMQLDDELGELGLPVVLVEGSRGLVKWRHGDQVHWLQAAREADYQVDGADWVFAGTVSSEAYVGCLHAFFNPSTDHLRLIRETT